MMERWRNVLLVALMIAIGGCGTEAATLVGRDGGAAVPEILGCRTVRSARSCRGIGFPECGGDIVPGPVSGVVVSGRVVIRPRCQRSDPGFDGPIVLGSACG